MKHTLLVICLVLLASALPAAAGNGVIFSAEQFEQTDTGDLIAWIYFKDKGRLSALKKQAPEHFLSERALARRLKQKPDGALIEFSDYPIFPDYVQTLRPFIHRLRARSRWLNAISVELSGEQLKRVSQFDFVDRIRPVRASRPRSALPEAPVTPKSTLAKTSALDYGSGYDQVHLINADVLHEKGLYGQGVLICMLDDGFNLLNHHIAFDSLDVQATWDFIHDDESVDDSEYAATEGTHGTKTLSTIGGYTPGSLIGTAFKATYLLAKTEVDASETKVEEDYWVEGIEWADSLGADVVSSSLGYIDWYTWQDMDGETATTTIAADLAVEKGILVLNSAGNEYDNADHNTLIAPADGNNVLAVAATYADGNRASFSSVGPSADGRIKPDIAAMGSGVTFASSYDDSAFSSGNGTSFSCPIAAGGAALLLNAFPDLTPAQVQQALRNTASQSDAPDKYLGWGVIDLEAAYNYIQASGLKNLPLSIQPKQIELFPNYPNPFNPSTTISYRLLRAGAVEISVFNMQGQKVLELPKIIQAGGNIYQRQILLENDASGLYFYHVKTTEIASGRRYTETGKMLLLK